MTAPLLKTKSQQRAEQLEALRRPLTDAESDELRRAIHANDMREQRQREHQRIAQHRNEELKLLAKLHAELRTPSRFG